VFKLLDCLIGQYKLNRTDELLADVADACESLGGEWRIKHIQSSAFCRWKQYRFREALDLFLRQQELVGASAALCENIGHTYSSLGDLAQAEAYLERAIGLLDHGSFGNRGGIYMGLGLVRERLGKVSEALPILQQSLKHYELEHTSNGHVADASIIAKAHMSVGKAHQKLNSPDEAASHMSEALRLFRKTCGEDSPLTANAMGCLGKLQATRGPSRRREALGLLRGALDREVRKDAFHLDTVWELLSKIKEVQLELAAEKQEREASGPATSRQAHLASLEASFSVYLPVIREACARVAPIHASCDPGTLAVFYKTAGELAMLAQDYQLGSDVLREALRFFAMVRGFDCSSLVEGCHSLLSIAGNNQVASSASSQQSSRGRGNRGHREHGARLSRGRA
jgi:tetratricopeptide (TPR) repeat protein